MPRVKLFDESEVLAKAMHLFWKKGYHATSIQDLVSNLGINRGSLYDTFGGKKELFDKAFLHYRTTSTQNVIDFLHSEHNIKKGLRRLFERSITESKCDPENKGCFVVNTITEMLPNETSTTEALDDHKTKFENIFYEYMSLGVDRGQISKDKDLKSIASLLFTMSSGLKVVTKVDVAEDALLKSVDTLLSLLD